jgi:hypothetical protein
MDKSQDHIAFAGRFEYFAFEGQVYRAPKECPIRCDRPVRNGARWVARDIWTARKLDAILDVIIAERNS